MFSVHGFPTIGQGVNKPQGAHKTFSLLVIGIVQGYLQFLQDEILKNNKDFLFKGAESSMI